MRGYIRLVDLDTGTYEVITKKQAAARFDLKESTVQAYMYDGTCIRERYQFYSDSWCVKFEQEWEFWRNKLIKRMEDERNALRS